jgi:hypothetical protein
MSNRSNTRIGQRIRTLFMDTTTPRISQPPRRVVGAGLFGAVSAPVPTDVVPKTITDHERAEFLADWCSGTHLARRDCAKV